MEKHYDFRPNNAVREDGWQQRGQRDPTIEVHAPERRQRPRRVGLHLASACACRNLECRPIPLVKTEVMIADDAS